MNQGVMVEWWGLYMKDPQPKDSYTKGAAHNGTLIKGRNLDQCENILQYLPQPVQTGKLAT